MNTNDLVRMCSMQGYLIRQARKRILQVGSSSSPKKSKVPTYSVRCGNKSRAVLVFQQWIRDRIQLTGDYMPHKEEIHLPPSSVVFFHKRYEKTMRRMKVDKSNTLAYTAFKKHLKTALGDKIKLPKTKTFSKCDECERLTTKEKQATTASDKAYWTMRMMEHDEIQDAEREEYYYHQYLSLKQPDKYISIIIDGMDQKKTQVPRQRRANKVTADMEGITMCVNGVICHGHSPRQQVYTFPSNFPKDSNMTVQTLVNALEAVYGKEGRLPKRLLLQLDNCGGENKNKTVLMFLLWLVATDVFEEVSQLRHVLCM
jgi:hypothetical protein